MCREHCLNTHTHTHHVKCFAIPPIISALSRRHIAMSDKWLNQCAVSFKSFRDVNRIPVECFDFIYLFIYAVCVLHYLRSSFCLEPFVVASEQLRTRFMFFAQRSIKLDLKKQKQKKPNICARRVQIKLVFFIRVASPPIGPGIDLHSSIPISIVLASMLLANKIKYQFSCLFTSIDLMFD